MSPKQAEVNKNKILDWLKEDNVVHEEVDVSQKPELKWNIHIKTNRIAVYTPTAYPDRVFIQSDLTFSEEQIDLLNKQWAKPKLSTLILQITSSLTNFNVRHTILTKEKEVTGIRIFLTLIDSLDKETLSNSLDRIVEVLNVTLHQLSSVMRVELQQLKEQQKAGSENPLAT